MTVRRAAKHYVLLATIVAGSLHADGLTRASVQPDPAETVRLLQHAAARGDVDAMASLGRMYVHAIGVPEDDVRGYALLQAALNKGLPADLADFAFYDLGLVTPRLDPTHLAQARLMARKLVSLSASDSPTAAASRASPALRHTRYIEAELDDSRHALGWPEVAPTTD